LAATNGTTGKALTELASRLTPEQLAEGKRRLATLTASPVNAASDATSPIIAANDPAAPASPAGTEFDQERKKLSAELAAAWQENELLKSGLNAKLADANKRVAIAEAALASKDKEIAALQSRLSEATAKASVPATTETPEITALRAERDQLKAAANTSSAELAELRASVAKSTSEQAALRGKLADAINDVAEARRAQTLAEAEAASLKAAADRASAERLATAAQLDSVTAELAAAKANPAPAPAPALSDTGLTVLKSDRDRLADLVKTLEQERDSLNAQLAAAKATAPVVAAQETVDTPAPAAEPVPDTAAKLTELEKAKNETDTKLAAALRSFTLQQAEIDRLQQSLSSIDAERATTAGKLEAASVELNTLRPQAASASTLSAEVETLRTQLAAANQTIADQTASLETANTNLAGARKTVDTATAELVATRDQLRQTQAQAAASAIESQQLKTRLALVGNLPASNTPSRPGTIAPTSVDLPPPAPVEAPAGPRVHTVAPGDSLSRISLRYYGTASRWNEILQANRDAIRNPDSLALGTKLRIP
jgi:nucleoid-associated protein YgaU